MNKIDRHGEELNTCGNCLGGDKHTSLLEVKCETPGKTCGLIMGVNETCINHSQKLINIVEKSKRNPLNF